MRSEKASEKRGKEWELPWIQEESERERVWAWRIITIITI